MVFFIFETLFFEIDMILFSDLSIFFILFLFDDFIYNSDSLLIFTENNILFDSSFAIPFCTQNKNSGTQNKNSGTQNNNSGTITGG